MVVGTLKNYILSEGNIGEFGIRVLKLDSSDFVELEISSNGKIIVRKKMDSFEEAKKFIRDMINKNVRNKDQKPEKKFNLKDRKEARINSDDPKAFNSDSPSTTPFMGDGPGGLLHHMEVMRDRKKRPFNKKKRRSEWTQPNGEEGGYFQLSRWGPENGPSRDSGPDRPGFDNALHKERDGFRQPLPTDEDSIERMRHPERFPAANYDPIGIYDKNSEQYLSDKNRKDIENKKQNRIQNLDSKDKYTIIINDKGKRKKLVDLTFQDATEKSRLYPGAKIVKQK